MSFGKLVTFVFGIIFIILLYVIIYYALKIMYKDVKTGGKARNNSSGIRYGIEVIQTGVNSVLEQGSVVPIRGIITLGRKPENTIVLTEPFVSGNHAKIYAKNNNLYVEDLNSTNGVYVNSEKIQEKYKLVADDEVKIGSAIFKVLKSGR
ncbi:FHA domain-containing protein [Clostridium sp. 1001271B_151109_B4]|uniref:FHA domain-containing protein n=1 Tax=Clostridium sp. 1001271B_151109_B4 TaxID=2787148 RepID=UPI0018AC6197|nr:FHA domain-containing protein [Clostridium sp. 1001271B_151109_B4]